MPLDFSKFGEPVELPDFSAQGEPLPFHQQPEPVREQMATEVADRVARDIPSRYPGGILKEPKGLDVRASDFGDALSYFTGEPIQEPSQSAQVGAGLLNAQNRMTEGMMQPTMVPLLAAGAAGPLAARAVSGYFFQDMLRATPEAARQAGTASVEGDTQEKTEAYATLGLNSLFTMLAGAHAGRPGLAREIPALRQALVKRINVEMEPAQVRDIYERVNRGQGTEYENVLVRELNQAIESPAQAIRKGVTVSDEQPRIQSERINEYLGVEPRGRSFSLRGVRAEPEAPVDFVPEPQPITPSNRGLRLRDVRAEPETAPAPVPAPVQSVPAPAPVAPLAPQAPVAQSVPAPVAQTGQNVPLETMDFSVGEKVDYYSPVTLKNHNGVIVGIDPKGWISIVNEDGAPVVQKVENVKKQAPAPVPAPVQNVAPSAGQVPEQVPVAGKRRLLPVEQEFLDAHGITIQEAVANGSIRPVTNISRYGKESRVGYQPNLADSYTFKNANEAMVKQKELRAAAEAKVTPDDRLRESVWSAMTDTERRSVRQDPRIFDLPNGALDWEVLKPFAEKQGKLLPSSATVPVQPVPPPAPEQAQKPVAEPVPAQAPAAAQARKNKPVAVSQEPVPAPVAQVPTTTGDMSKKFNPKQAKEQKKFLLGAVDEAIAQAPDVPALEIQKQWAASEMFKAKKAYEEWAANNPYPRQPNESDYGYDNEKFKVATEEFKKAQLAWDAKRDAELAQLAAPYMSEINAGESVARALTYGTEAAFYRTLPHITIEVPGDGAFSIVNTKDALRAFKERAKGFPTTLGEVKEPATKRATASEVPALGKPTTENIVEAVASSLTTDKGRPILTYIWSDGKQTVATDGRSIVIIGKGIGGTVKNPKLFTKEGELASDQKQSYPNWPQVVPLGNTVVFKELDAAKLWTVLKQAQQVRIDKREMNVILWRNEDGTLGIDAKSTEGEYEHNVQPGAKLLMAIDPQYLMNGLEAAIRVGDAKVDFAWNDELSPLVVQSKLSKTVIMPWRLERGTSNSGLASGVLRKEDLIPTEERIAVMSEELARLQKFSKSRKDDKARIIELERKISDLQKPSPEQDVAKAEAQRLADEQPQDMQFSLGQSGTGLSAETLRTALSELISESRPETVQIVQSESELPPEVQDEIARIRLVTGQTAPYEGMMWNGRIYLIADFLPTIEKAQEVLLHEYVHLGLEEDQSFLDAVIERYQGTVLLQEVQRLYVPTEDGVGRAPQTRKERYLVAHEILARIGEGKISDPTLWQRFLAWLTQLLRKLGLRKTVGENEIRRALSEARDRIRDSARTDAEPMFSYTDPESLTAAKRLTENARPEEQEHVRALAVVPSQATIGHVLPSFQNLPQGVKDVLGDIVTREQILTELQAWWNPADTRPLSEQIMERSGGDPRVFRSIMGAVMNNFERYRQTQIDMGKSLDSAAQQVTGAFNRLGPLEPQTIKNHIQHGLARQQIEVAQRELDNKIRSEPSDATRSALQRLRSMITSFLDVDEHMVRSIFRETSRLTDAQLTELVADVQGPNVTTRDIRAKWRIFDGMGDEQADAALGVLRLNRSLYQQLVAAREATLPATHSAFQTLNQPTIETLAAEYNRLREISPVYGRMVAALSPELKQAMQRYNKLDRANQWLAQTAATPQFQRNWEDATRTLGVESIEHKDNGLELTYKNPNVPEAQAQSVVIQMNPLTTEEWQVQQQNIQTVSQWMLEYLANGTDPVRREAYRNQLEFLNAVLRGDVGNPKQGRLTQGAMDIMGVIRSAFDVPEMAGRFLGGVARAELNRAVKNYSEVRHFAANVFRPMAIEIDRAVKRAANQHKLKPLQWKAAVLEPMLRNEMAVGDRHYRQGDLLPGGLVVTLADINAVKAQRRLFDAMAGGIAKLSTIFPGMKLSPSKIRRKEGERRALKTEAIGGTENMLPRSFSNAGETLAKDWMEIERTLKGEDNEAARQAALIRLIEDPANYPILLTYFSTFSDPSFPVDSPLRESALEVQRDIEAGSVPQSFDEWITRLQDKEAQRDPPVLMSEAAVQEQVLKDLTETMARVDKARTDDESTSKEDPMLDVLDAKNFMNRPRGDTIGLKGMYDVGLATMEDQMGLMVQVTQVFGQELLNKWRSAERQLREYRKQLEGRVEMLQDRGAVQAETEQGVKAGTQWYKLEELDSLLNALNKQISQFGGMKEQGLQISNQMLLPRGMRAFRAFLVRNLLQGVNTLTNNWLGGLAKMNDLDIALGYKPKSTVRNVRAMAKNLVTVTADMMADWALGDPESKGPLTKMVENMRRNPGPFNALAESMVKRAEKMQERFAKMSELGLVNFEPFMPTLKARWELRREGGMIRAHYPTKTMQGVDQALNAWEGLWDIGSLGGRLTAMADAMVNVTAFDKTREFVGDLELNILKAFRERVARGEDPANITLSPEEIFGSKLANPKSIQYLKIWFEENGLNFDQLARDYYRKVQAAPEFERGSIWLMDKYGLNGLAQTVANQINRAAYSNRPQNFAGSAYGRSLLLFLGYGLNDNAQLSMFYAKPTQGSKKFQEARTISQTFIPALLMRIALGTLVAAPLISWLAYELYKKRRANKLITDAENSKEMAEAIGTATGPFLPLVGQALNHVLGPGNQPGRGFMNTGFQLAPLSFMEQMMKSANQVRQTGDLTRPALQFLTQYAPLSQVAVNRMPMMEGLAAVQSDVAAQRAKTPSSIELRKPLQGEVRYSPAWSQIQDLKNEIGKTEQNIERQQEIREKGAAAYAKAGNPEPYKAFDKAFLASANKFLQVYGRELTPQEKAKIESKMTPEEKSEGTRIEQNLQAFAQRNGDPVPDFVRTRERGTGGTGAVTGYGGGASRADSSAVLGGTGSGQGYGIAPRTSLRGATGVGRFRTGRSGARRLRGGYGLRRISASPRRIRTRGFRGPRARRSVRQPSLRAIKL